MRYGRVGKLLHVTFMLFLPDPSSLHGPIWDVFILSQGALSTPPEHVILPFNTNDNRITWLD